MIYKYLKAFGTANALRLNGLKSTKPNFFNYE